MIQFLLDSLTHFKYVAIFLGTFFEGPLVGLLVGVLSKTNQIQIGWGYFAHVFGDLSADMVYFSLGYFGGRKLLPKLAKWLHFDPEESEKSRKFLHKHAYKIIIFGKISHIFGFPILIGVGLARYSIKKFFIFDLIATLIKSALLIGLGYFFGSLLQQTNNTFVFVSAVGSILLLVFVLYYLLRRHIEYLIEKNKLK